MGTLLQIGMTPRIMASTTIRNADRNDLAALTALSGQLGYSVKESDVAERLEVILQRDDNAVFVAELDRKVVGWAQVVAMRLLESPPFAELTGLVVDQDTRGRGLGRRLVEACAQWAHDRQLQQIRVRSNIVREEAHRFYMRVGFEKIKSQAVFAMTLPAHCSSSSRSLDM
jgi:N-acetylglutamate synthase-like GNAT family acetyltransferase